MAIGSWTFTVSAGEVDETQRSGEAPSQYVIRLAAEKARAVAPRLTSGEVVVAADTTVVDGGQLLGKPQNATEATAMLKQLRGRTHKVFTGLAVLNTATGQSATDLCVTDVPMRNYSDAEVERYVNSGDPLDKAGAYAVQHAEFHPVEGLQGCFASVMGLPLCHLIRLLPKVGVPRPDDIPMRCQMHLNYRCPVSSAILRGEQAG